MVIFSGVGEGGSFVCFLLVFALFFECVLLVCVFRSFRVFFYYVPQKFLHARESLC